MTTRQAFREGRRKKNFNFAAWGALGFGAWVPGIHGVVYLLSASRGRKCRAFLFRMGPSAMVLSATPLVFGFGVDIRRSRGADFLLLQHHLDSGGLQIYFCPDVRVFGVCECVENWFGPARDFSRYSASDFVLRQLHGRWEMVG